jgi:hypothetical protein
VISAKTVEHRLGAIFAKLGVSNRTQLVAAMASYRKAVPAAAAAGRSPRAVPQG